MIKFKRIKGYRGYYISSNGRVFSVNGVFKKELKQHKNGRGYYGVGLSREGTTTRFLVHRLVAQAFIGKIPDGFVVNHIDENKINNSIKNLEIVTQKQNVTHSIELKDSKNITQRNLKGELIAIWDNVSQAVKCGFDQKTLLKSIRSNVKCSKGFIWNYGVDEEELKFTDYIHMRTSA